MSTKLSMTKDASPGTVVTTSSIVSPHKAFYIYIRDAIATTILVDSIVLLLYQLITYNL